MSQTNAQRLRYFWWAARRLSGERNHHCPVCGCLQTKLVGRKYLITSLRECTACSLRFRAPREDQESNHEYYQEDYSEGFTTDCPSDKQLQELIDSGFRGSDRDYTRYIAVMQAAGLAKRQSVLDFGSSWGYGSWQLRDFGYDVWSYEISRSRAHYAQQRLGCRMVEALDQLPDRVDCMFSSHVIEHLPDPSLIWKVADTVLNENGTIVCFCPNGNPALESSKGRYHYGCLWGKHHPMVITPQFMIEMSSRMGFDAKVFSGPYNYPYALDNISHGFPDVTMNDDELCLIARRIQTVSNMAGS